MRWFRRGADRPAKPLRWSTPRWSEITRLRRATAQILRLTVWGRIVALYAAIVVVGMSVLWAVWPNLVLPPLFWWQAIALPGALCFNLLAQNWLMRYFAGRAAIGPKWVGFGIGQSFTVVKWPEVTVLRLTVFAPDRVRLRVEWQTPKGRRRARHVGVPSTVNLRELRSRCPIPVTVRDARGRIGLTGGRVEQERRRADAQAASAGAGTTGVGSSSPSPSNPPYSKSDSSATRRMMRSVASASTSGVFL
ncbi:hypothetical protein LzC2_21480 [Planctomycetes bacterium LzC2]|uniref:PH domain-containing protein n=1 Tax=Alienimonas chondri TaxID=2681879 RepID=A0ABX1VDE4_9PLAN|nr:hypothetical protein [Alienimonas chondri]